MSSPLVRSVLFLVVLAVLAVPGCSGDKGKSGEGTAADRFAPTAWDRVVGQMGPNGEVSLSMALQAFSVRFVPLPGVDVPKGVPEKGLHSGTAALRWITRYWERLTPEQKKVAAPFVDPEGKLTGRTRRRALTGLPGRDRAPSPTATPTTSPEPGTTMFPEGKKAVDTMVAWYSDPRRLNLPKGLALPYTVLRTTELPENPEAAAATHCVDAYGLYNSPLPPTHTKITVYAKPGNNDPRVLEYVLAHEVFHMFQCSMQPTTSAFLHAPSWVAEGSASWAAQEYTGDIDVRQWSGYLKLPRTKLFEWSYEAQGFYAQLDQNGIDWWKRLRPMLAAGKDNEKAFAAVGPTDRFLDAWAAGFFRAPALGSDWDIARAASGIAATPEPVTVSTDAAVPFKAESYANRIANVQSKADILHLTATGRARIADGPNNDHRGVTDAYFCTKAGGCKCPKGTAGAAAVEKMPRLKPDSSLALTGGTKGVDASLAGLSLKDFCKEKKKGGVLACLIPVPRGKPASIQPGRYEGTITFTKNVTMSDGGKITGSGKGPAAFTVEKNGRIVAGTYSLPHRVALSRGGGQVVRLEMRVDRAPITGTTAKPALTWRPRVTKVHGEEWWVKLRPILEAQGKLPMSAMKPTKACDAVTATYRVDLGASGFQQLVVRARPKR